MMILVMGVACSKDNVEESPEKVGKEEKKEDIALEDMSLYPLDIEDGLGVKWTFEEEPERIISLAPSHGEILFALGLDERIVGVSTYDDFPPAALEKERIGDAQSVNLERIIELEPDLILNYGLSNDEDLKRLKEAGIKVLGFEPETIDEVMDTIKVIGKITNKEETADNIVRDMAEKKASIIKALEGVEKKRVFYEIWHEPLMAAGPGSFMDELITIAGGINIAQDAEKGYANYDLESLIEKDPQIYITSDHVVEINKDSISARPGYEAITAIKEGNIYLLDGDITSRPGPRIVEALELVARAIHPEIIK